MHWSLFGLLFVLWGCEQIIMRPCPQFAVFNESPIPPPPPLPEEIPPLGPNQRWVSGHWTRTSDGWEWRSGHVALCSEATQSGRWTLTQVGRWEWKEPASTQP